MMTFNVVKYFLIIIRNLSTCFGNTCQIACQLNSLNQTQQKRQGVKWIISRHTEHVMITALLLSPLNAWLQYSPTCPHVNPTLMYFPGLPLNHSAPVPSILQTLLSSLSSLASLTVPFLSSHPATLIALLCQMSQPIVPPVKSWWEVRPI